MHLINTNAVSHWLKKLPPKLFPIWPETSILRTYDLDPFLRACCELIISHTLFNQAWHECYHSETGDGLAAPGFLSWNVLAATLLDNIVADVNPFDL
jgi:hypothetical protein